MFPSVPTLALLRRGVVLATMGLLAACSTEQDWPGIEYAEWQQMEPPPRLEVRETPVAHQVNFLPNSAEISQTESGALAGFLADHNVGAGKQVALQAPPTTAADTERASRRLAAIRTELEAYGVSAIVNPPGAQALADPNQVLVIASEQVAIAPDCPGYNQPVKFDRFNRPILRMGCFNETNLGLMVADPSDLVRGRPLAPADAERSTLAIQKYRSGKSEESSQPSSPVAIVPMTTSSGSGGN